MGTDVEVEAIFGQVEADPYLDAYLQPIGLTRLAQGPDYFGGRFHSFLNRKLMEVEKGGIRRLALSVPPQHGKSTLTSQGFPAWWLGHHPDRKVILASYGADLANDFGGEVRSILSEFGGDVFGPGCLPKPGDEAKGNWKTVEGGGMFTAGVGGGATGRGAGLFIVDDPVKNYEEAASPVIQRRNLNWYRSVALTRLAPKAPVILIGTRWHEKDLIGQVLADAKQTGEEWEVINFKALAGENDPLGRKPGEALFPLRYNEEELAWRKRAMGTFLWSALYQGEPTPEGGGQFRADWFRYYEIEEHENGATYFVLMRRDTPTGPVERKRVSFSSCWMFQTIDTAGKVSEANDWFVVGTWAVTPDKELILLDIDRRRADTTKHDDIVRRNYLKWRDFGLMFVGVEEKQYGQNILEGLRGEVPMKPLYADRDKVSRSLLVSARYETGMVFHPVPDSIYQKTWLETFEAELVAFPNGEHDDQVDVTSYAGIQVFAGGLKEVGAFGPKGPTVRHLNDELGPRPRREVG